MASGGREKKAVETTGDPKEKTGNFSALFSCFYSVCGIY
jgi:hypothetical protein